MQLKTGICEICESVHHHMKAKKISGDGIINCADATQYFRDSSGPHSKCRDSEVSKCCGD